MRRAFTWKMIAFLLLVLVGVPAAIACIADSEGIQLLDGELPGGG